MADPTIKLYDTSPFLLPSFPTLCNGWSGRMLTRERFGAIQYRLLIGPSSSGKTALLLRYVEDIFDTDNATATIGVDFKVPPSFPFPSIYLSLASPTANADRQVTNVMICNVGQETFHKGKTPSSPPL